MMSFVNIIVAFFNPENTLLLVLVAMCTCGMASGVITI